MNDSIVRKYLVEFLAGGIPHVTPQEALDKLRPENRHIRPHKQTHSIWEELEHLRIAHEDVIRYTFDQNWKSPAWPDGYWPKEGENLTEEMWVATVTNYYRGLEEWRAVTEDTSLDLTKEIPHGEGRTYLRQILLIIAHNAYHLGKVVQNRKELDNWPD